MGFFIFLTRLFFNLLRGSGRRLMGRRRLG